MQLIVVSFQRFCSCIQILKRHERESDLYKIKPLLFPDRLRSKQVNLLKRILIFVVENVTI